MFTQTISFRNLFCTLALFAFQAVHVNASNPQITSSNPQILKSHLQILASSHPQILNSCDKDAKLTAGTLVMLETAERVSSDQVTVGKVIQFKVTMNVMAEGEVAIRSGAVALGRVKAIEKSTYNEPESIRIEMMHVQAVDGQMVALNGNEQTIKGRYKGEAATIETGTSITANVTNDIEIEAK